MVIVSLMRFAALCPSSFPLNHFSFSSSSSHRLFTTQFFYWNQFIHTGSHIRNTVFNTVKILKLQLFIYKNVTQDLHTGIYFRISTRVTTFTCTQYTYYNTFNCLTPVARTHSHGPTRVAVQTEHLPYWPSLKLRLRLRENWTDNSLWLILFFCTSRLVLWALVAGRFKVAVCFIWHVVQRGGGYFLSTGQFGRVLRLPELSPNPAGHDCSHVEPDSYIFSKMHMGLKPGSKFHIQFQFSWSGWYKQLCDITPSPVGALGFPLLVYQCSCISVFIQVLVPCLQLWAVFTQLL